MKMRKKRAQPYTVFTCKLGCKYNLHLLITLCDNSHKMRISNECARFAWWSSCFFFFFPFFRFIYLFLLFPYDIKMVLLAGFVLIEIRWVRGFHFRTLQTYLSILLAMSHYIASGSGLVLFRLFRRTHSFGSFWSRQFLPVKRAASRSNHASASSCGSSWTDIISLYFPCVSIKYLVLLVCALDSKSFVKPATSRTSFQVILWWFSPFYFLFIVSDGIKYGNIYNSSLKFWFSLRSIEQPNGELNFKQLYWSGCLQVDLFIR